MQSLLQCTLQIFSLFNLHLNSLQSPLKYLDQSILLLQPNTHPYQPLGHTKLCRPLQLGIISQYNKRTRQREISPETRSLGRLNGVKEGNRMVIIMEYHAEKSTVSPVCSTECIVMMS